MAIGLRVGSVGPQGLSVRQKFLLCACGCGEHGIFHSGLTEGFLMATLANCSCGVLSWGLALLTQKLPVMMAAATDLEGEHGCSGILGTWIPALSKDGSAV